MSRYLTVLCVFFGLVIASYLFHNIYLFFAAPIAAFIASVMIRVWRVERGGKWFDA